MKPYQKGAAYVAVQLGLIAAYLFYPSPICFALPKILSLIAAGVAVFGLAITSVATFQLNKRLSPFPAPRSNAVLLQTGVYKYVRHPIYSGLSLFGFGWAIHGGDGLRFAIAIAILALFYAKSKYEEELLVKTFADYPVYQEKTGMLFPRFKR